MIKKGLKKLLVDKGLIITTILLSIVGLLLVFSASSPEAVLKYGDGYYFFKRHIRSLVIGFVALVFAAKFNYKYYKKFALAIIIFSIFLNFLLYTKFGESALGQSRWLDLPFLPMFMPSDTLKPASIIFMAFYLEALGKNIRKPKGVFISAVFIVFFVLIIFLKDMGSSIIILASLGCMLLVAGIRKFSAIFLILSGVVAATVSLQIKAFEYRLRRLTSFLKPFENMQGDGMQQGNSIYSIALGGVTGVGLGRGVQKFSYIPHVYNDFIFSVMAEEFGLVGAMALVIMFFYYCWRGLIIAFNCKDRFGKYLAVGLTSSIFMQAVVHILVNIGFAPVTGITLPFISYGGTSLIITMYITGILLNISKENKRRK